MLFKLRLLFALLSVCICICIPHRVVATTHMYSDSKRTMGNRYGSDVVRVTLFVRVCAQVCSCSRCVIERCSVQFRRIAFVRIGDREGQTGSVYLFAREIYTKLRESRNLLRWREGIGQESTICQPHSYRRRNEWGEHRLTLRLTLAFPIARRWIIVSD